jgi:hypothetical protein
MLVASVMCQPAASILASLSLLAACGEVKQQVFDAAAEIDGANTIGGATTHVVSGAIEGAPPGTVVTASSTTAGAVCSGDRCMVPVGGSVSLTAPVIAGYYFAGWAGSAVCVGTDLTLTVFNVNATIACMASYKITYLITITVAGGPGGTMITPSSPTLGATCVSGSCRVPIGGSVSATSPTLTNWFFNGWTGLAATSSVTATLSSITSDGVLTARYINTMVVPCLNQPPANASTTSTPNVMITYTTAGGWSTPTVCPWSCNADYCVAGGACVITFFDRIAYTSGRPANGLAAMIARGSRARSAPAKA